MNLNQWILKKTNNRKYNSDNGINLIELNSAGNIVYQQSITIVNNEFFLTNYSNQFFNLFFFQFLNYYFMFAINIKYYQVNIITLNDDKSFNTNLSLSISIDKMYNDHIYDDYYDMTNESCRLFYLLQYDDFDLYDHLRFLTFTYNLKFDFRKIKQLFNEFYTKELPRLNYVNQINYFYLKFWRCLTIYAKNKQVVSLTKALNFDQYIHQNFYFSQTKYMHELIYINADGKNKKYFVYSTQKLKLWNIQLIPAITHKHDYIPKHFIYQFNQFYTIYSIDNNYIQIVKFVKKMPIHIIHGPCKHLNKKNIYWQITLALLATKISKTEYNYLKNNYSHMMNVPHKLLYCLK